ncbi:hypothetical protein BJ165DRAFT_1529365 [Panaeolus papilionaceus]|nr:hypothetical protein BJ165DRAFT_1529365 [Panaeolus papilionaceus]
MSQTSDPKPCIFSLIYGEGMTAIVMDKQGSPSMQADPCRDRLRTVYYLTSNAVKQTYVACQFLDRVNGRQTLQYEVTASLHHQTSEDIEDTINAVDVPSMINFMQNPSRYSREWALRVCDAISMSSVDPNHRGLQASTRQSSTDHNTTFPVSFKHGSSRL